jgi:anti-sigma regulatory factor (Ser/Thr protein kinase)
MEPAATSNKETRGSSDIRGRELLQSRGVSGETLEDLVAYGAALLEALPRKKFMVPPDEPHLEAWATYAADARTLGAVGALERRFPQLRFPIREGISGSDSYRRATRKGISPDDDPEACGLTLKHPESIRLEIYETFVGRVPILTAEDRADFEALVRAFSARNEPVAVPRSMGACIVTGLNNWDRIRTYRARWEASHPRGDWQAEFSRLIPRKELYEDRLIILSQGPYSGVAASRAGFARQRWLDLSLQIRREHECTHYFTFRICGKIRNNLSDEIIADYVGLVRAFGRYPDELALLLFGLEDYPRYRQGARLQNYLGQPPLSDDAFAVVRELVYESIQNLARFDATRPAPMREGSGLARLVVGLMSMRLEELAWANLAETLFAGEASKAAPSRGAALEISADRQGIDQAMAALSDFAAAHALSDKVSADLHLVLDELLSNIVKYGEAETGSVCIRLRLRKKRQWVEIEVADTARQFDPLARQDPDLTRPLSEKPIGGLGVYLVKRLTDEQSYERRGGENRLLIRKRL